MSVPISLIEVRSGLQVSKTKIQIEREYQKFLLQKALVKQYQSQLHRKSQMSQIPNPSSLFSSLQSLEPFLLQNFQVKGQNLPYFPQKYFKSLQNRARSQKQNRELFEYFRDKKIFSKITNLKLLFDLIYGLETLKIIPGEELTNDSNDCWILMDGIVKKFEVDESQEIYYKESEDLRVTLSHWRVPKNYVEVGRLENGDIFLGKNANDELDTKYIAVSVSKFMVIRRQLYEPLIEVTYHNEQKKKQDFLLNIPLFSKMYRSSIIALLDQIKQIELSFNKPVYREGDRVKNIYIVKSGEFLLEKTIRNDAILKHGKIKMKTENDEDKNSIKKQIKHYRVCPYKIVSSGEVLGDCEFICHDQTYLNSLKCHKQGSKLYSIDAQLFFKKLAVPEIQPERLFQQLQAKYKEKQQEIKKNLKHNFSNSIILRFMPNSTAYLTKEHELEKKKVIKDHVRAHSHYHTSTNQEISYQNKTFFDKCNKTIINGATNRLSFRRRNYTQNQEYFGATNKSIDDKPKNMKKMKSLTIQSSQKQAVQEQRRKRRNKRIPAIVQEVVQIVSLKEAYHKLRGLNKQKKGAFEFQTDNVPTFIKKKYAHIYKNR